MKKFLFSLLIISNLFTCFAAEIEQPLLPAAIDNIEHTYTVEIEGQEPFIIRTRQTNLFKLGMIRESARLYPEERTIALRDNFSRHNFENLIAYLNIDSLEVIHHMGIDNLRRSFLSHCSPDEFVGLIQTMDALLLDVEERYEIIEFALKKLNFESFKQLIERHLLHGSSETISIILKEMQLAALGADEIAKRDLAHPTHLGAEKVTLLKENGLWNVEISIEDLYNNAATRDLLNPYPFNKLNLSNRFITNLNGSHLIPDSNRIRFFLLNNNQLTYIAPAAFTSMPTLQMLYLDHNHLTAIDSTVFNSTPLLLFLSLDNNQLTNLDPALFANTPHLRYLDLGINKLTTINPNMLSQLPLLKSLCLSNNQITELAPTAFSNKPELKNLWLDSNRIAEIKRGTFDNLPRLEKLSLFGNPLKNIPVLPNFSWKKSLGVSMALGVAGLLALHYTHESTPATRAIITLASLIGGPVAVTGIEYRNYKFNLIKFRRLHADVLPTCEVIL